jgi:eukaryotic-like serine/threonine-protein kinase
VATRLTGDQAAELLRASLEPGSSPVPVPPAAAVDTGAGVQPPVMAPVVTWQNPIYLDEEGFPDVDQMGGSSAGIPSRSFSFVATGPNSADAEPAYDEPSYPERGYEHPAGDPPSGSTWRRRTGLLAVLTVLVAAGLTALLLAWTRTVGTAQAPPGADTSGSSGRHHHHRGAAGSSNQNTPSSTGSASQSPPTSTPTATATSTSATSSAPTTAASTAVTGRVPPGYQLVHDPLGFQVAVPDGWSRRTSGASRVDYVSPTNSAMYLRVDQVPQAAPSAVQAWRDYEPTLAKQLPGFHLIRLESVPFRHWQAADLEFTWQGANTKLHVLDRGFITHPRGFALLMSGPDATWQSQSLPVFNVAGATFAPRP